ncbi:MAG: hypothetical protein R2761_25685 [Acidimicrobiales bacterium]
MGVELDLLDLAPPAHDEASVTYGRPGRFWAAVAGGLLAVVVGLWALSAIGGGDAGDAAAGPDRPTTTRVTARAATSPPTTERADPAASDVLTTTSDGGATPSTSVLADGGPLLGQPVGLSLLIGSQERLRRLDLDTGVMTGSERAGLPLFGTGRWVLVQGSSGLVRALPLADLDADVPSLWAQYSPVLPRPGPDPGQIWLPDAAGPTLVWRLVDAGSRDVLQEVDSGVAAWWDQAEAVIDPQVIGSGTGEVFERDGAAFRRVAEGELVAVGRTVVLVRRCTDPASCTLHWMDRASWREVPAAVPDNRAQELTTASISDDGRLLLYTTATESFLFDVSRGREVMAVGTWPGTLSVSPDGRWAVVVHVAGRIALYDVERGETVELPVSTSGDGQVVVVPSV